DYALSISCAASYSELFLHTPSPPFPRCVYIFVLSLKSVTSEVSDRAQRCHAVAACFHHRSGNSHWIVACQCFSLTQFNLPVVMLMMKHT
ncbi:Hypothetical predicted protein, partial [Scomber scombrus]